MKKLFIVQPMHGLTEEEVMDTRKQAYIDALRLAYKKGYVESGEELEVIDQYHVDPPEKTGRLWLLGRSIQMIGVADFVYFAEGWESAKGCVVERFICEKYRINVLN